MGGAKHRALKDSMCNRNGMGFAVIEINAVNSTSKALDKP